MASWPIHNDDMALDQVQMVLAGVRQGIIQIQNGNTSSLKYEELYRDVYTLVRHKRGALLYDAIIQVIQQKLADTAEAKIDVSSDDGLVCILLAEWENHKKVMRMISDVLLYMERMHCKPQGQTSVYQTGIGLFCKTIIERPSCQNRIEFVLFRNMQCKRHNQPIDQEPIKHCLEMLIECGRSSTIQENLYERLFERKFLEESRHFYKLESVELISQNTVPDYLLKVEQRLKEEDTRVDDYLYRSTRCRLLTICQEELIAKCARKLIENPNSGCRIMLQRHSLDDLRRLYMLFKRCPGTLSLISHCLESVARDAENQIVYQENNEEPHKFVQSCLDLRSKYFHIVQASFNGDQSFTNCLKECFEHGTNPELSRALAMHSEMVAEGWLMVAPRSENIDDNWNMIGRVTVAPSKD